MRQYTYDPPESGTFLYNIRRYLEAQNQHEAAGLLVDATCDVFSTDDYSSKQWDVFEAVIRLFVRLDRIARFNDEILEIIAKAANAVIPINVGFEIVHCEVSPKLEVPPSDDQSLGNSASLVQSGPIEHNGLRFRSRTETRIYDALKKRRILFLPNATAVLGGTELKREPDFLICQEGKWGILEVLGKPYHEGETAVRDHDRARLFKDYGLLFIEFYDANRCYEKPDEVVEDFLKRLSKS